MVKVTTLGEFIIERQMDVLGSSGEFSRLLSGIELAAKVVSEQVNKAGLMQHILGATDQENVQGEQQQKLDVYANEQFIKALTTRKVVCGVASEENTDFIAIDPNSNYIVSIDPLDGSSNIDVNVSIGTIFSVYRRRTPTGTVVTTTDFLQRGTEQLAAGYIIYGSSTMLVYTTGNGVNGFTYDPGAGVFVLSHPQIKMPTEGTIYSVNEGNFCKSSAGVQRYIEYARAIHPETKRPYTGRYIGSLVADFHRNLIKGGVYLYPAIQTAPRGKLRLLYECSPLAMIAEQAGGKASDGRQRILDMVPHSLHQRTPYFVGSTSMVEKIESFIKDEA